MQPKARQHEPGEAMGRHNTVISAQGAGLRAASFVIVLLSVLVIGVPVVEAVERLSLDMETILRNATLTRAVR
jgi:hypothetical protein